MEPFIKHTGRIVVMNRANVDTDQIIPKQFLKRIERTGFGEFLFHDWRRHEDGSDHPDFELNQDHAEGASVLIARRNFGSGSSREHAVWAIADYGFRVLLAPSFADIFHGNCFQNGILPIILPEEIIEDLFQRAEATPGFELTIDLEHKKITDGHGLELDFHVDPHRRDCLLAGLDDIGLTLEHEDAINNYEAQHGITS